MEMSYIIAITVANLVLFAILFLRLEALVRIIENLTEVHQANDLSLLLLIRKVTQENGLRVPEYGFTNMESLTQKSKDTESSTQKN